MAWAFDPAKYQSQVSQNNNFHFQKVHQDGTCGKNEECEAGLQLVSLQEHPKRKKKRWLHLICLAYESESADTRPH